MTASQEIGCPHDFGATYQCPFCGAVRSVSTHTFVTERYNREHPGEGGYHWPPPFDEAQSRTFRVRLLRLLRLLP